MHADVRRLFTVTVAVVAAAVPVAEAATHVRPSPSNNGAQPVVILNREVVALAAPRPGAARVAAVRARTPFTGSQTVLPVLRKAAGPTGGEWLRVRLPARPNGSIGWIPADAGAADRTAWRIVIRRDERRAVVYAGGKARAGFSIVVGKPATPTPLGTFFVVDKLRVRAGTAGAPWALATSAYSDVLQKYEGGRGQVALHGTTAMAGRLGTFSSHGCIRFAPSAITWIAHHVDAGTPIFVSR